MHRKPVRDSHYLYTVYRVHFDVSYVMLFDSNAVILAIQRPFDEPDDRKVYIVRRQYIKRAKLDVLVEMIVLLAKNWEYQAQLLFCSGHPVGLVKQVP